MVRRSSLWQRSYKFFWNTHKWMGIVGAIVFLNLAVTGFLLLIKKDYDWIQPPTQEGAPGHLADFLTVEQVIDVVLSQGHPAFAGPEDVSRIDLRVSHRVHKVQSVHDNAEMQVDAVTGEVLRVDVRRSDFIEDLHDGSFFADWAHDYLMPTAAIVLMLLVASGLYLWLAPIYRRRTRRRR